MILSTTISVTKFSQQSDCGFLYGNSYLRVIEKKKKYNLENRKLLYIFFSCMLSNFSEKSTVIVIEEVIHIIFSTVYVISEIEIAVQNRV